MRQRDVGAVARLHLVFVARVNGTADGVRKGAGRVHNRFGVNCVLSVGEAVNDCALIHQHHLRSRGRTFVVDRLDCHEFAVIYARGAVASGCEGNVQAQPCVVVLPVIITDGADEERREREEEADEGHDKANRGRQKAAGASVKASEGTLCA